MSYQYSDYQVSEDFPRSRHVIETLPIGYYALRRGDTADIDFIRVSKPSVGKFKGSFKVQTQHSDLLRPALVHFNYEGPFNRHLVTIWHPGIEQKLLDVVVQMTECRMLYAAEKKKCFRCGKKLTDARSRWYTFGPECERHLQAFKEELEDLRGTDFEHAEVEIDF